MSEAHPSAADAQRASQRYQLLVRAAGVLAEGIGVDVSLQRLVELLVPVQLDYASIWVSDRRGVLGRVAACPVATPLHGADADDEAQRALELRAILQATTLRVIEDLPAWIEREGGSAALPKGALARCVIVPVRTGDASARAALFVGHTLPGAYAADEVSLLETLAGLISLATAARSTASLKDEFLARVSHDLRYPLSSIIGWAALLKVEYANLPRFAYGMEVIERNAKSQIRLIEDLLDVSRMLSGKLSLEISLVPVAEAIEVALDAARLEAAAKGISIDLHVSSDVGSIAVDRGRFYQVLWNLASNAIKFSERGGRVRVIAERVRSQLVIVFADEGRGIDPAFLPHVFTALEQAGASSERSSGLGLGLAIVRHIMQLHGGTVEARSAGLGLGAELTVRFPA